jgi:hypothetical protein
MRGLWSVRHITVSIDRPPTAVYELASDPQNLPRWAKGLAGSITRIDDETWLADAPMGKVKVRFADANTLGVLDHDVTLESGVTIHNPMRVLPNAGGSEVLFSLFRRPGITDAEFESDASAVARDLRALKALLEGNQ